MRVGLWSLTHMHAYGYLAALQARGDVDLVGLADEEVERGARVAAERGLAFYPDAEDLLRRVDAMIITSANADHRAMAERAAQAGVSVLLEKPIATTYEDGRAIVAAFERAGRTLAIAFPCPFSPAFRALCERYSQGELGRLLAIRATNRGSMQGGFFIELDRSGGGAVIDHTVHVADLLRRLTGADPVSVYAEIGHGLYHESWDDSGLLTIAMGDGSVATLDCSWSRPSSYPTWGDVNLKVIGTKATAEARLFDQHIAYYPAQSAPARWISWGSDLDALMIDDFIAAVTCSHRPMSTGEDGLWALKVALAAYASGGCGAPIRLDALGTRSERGQGAR